MCCLLLTMMLRERMLFRKEKTEKRNRRILEAFHKTTHPYETADDRGQIEIQIN